jgi:hypothetical protein
MLKNEENKIMGEIKRYSLYVSESGRFEQFEFAEISEEECAEGDWVKYSDCEERLKKLTNELEEIKSKLIKLKPHYLNLGSAQYQLLYDLREYALGDSEGLHPILKRDKRIIGANLKKIRLEREILINTVSDMLGINPARYCDVENNRVKMYLLPEQIKSLSALLGAAPKEFME